MKGHFDFIYSSLAIHHLTFKEKKQLYDNDEPFSLRILASSQAEKGMFDEGITMLQLFRDIPVIKMMLAYLYGKAGKKWSNKEKI